MERHLASLDKTIGCLGRIAPKATPKALHLRQFLEMENLSPPKATNFWRKRAPFKPGSWGNRVEGCCTIAKQVNMFRRFERLELRQTVSVDPNEVHRVYREMTSELYGGGDTGAYETDALDRSRRPEKCLHTPSGHPLLIDAYVRVDAWDQVAVRSAMSTAAGKGLAVCLNLPAAWASSPETGVWDLPSGTSATGRYEPGSWGGHSMWTFDYDEVGPWLDHTWDRPSQQITWGAAAVYMDECHLVVDSVDEWRQKKKAEPASDLGYLDLDLLVEAVNDVSSQKIKR